MERIAVEGADGGLEAWLARPAGEGPFPGVVLAHGEDGLEGAATVWAQRLAAEGLLVLAPRLTAPSAPPERAREALATRSATAQVEAVLRQLQERGDVDAERTAAVGLGAGGTLAFLLACTTRRRLAAAADVGGPLVHGSLGAERPNQPLELALNLECPLLVLLASGDPRMPPDHGEEIERKLGQFARSAEVAVLEGPGDALLGSGAGGYDGAPAREAWRRTLAFLRDHLD